PQGKPVPAAFRAVNRWWTDAATQAPSIQWVHGDFFADVPASGRAQYRLKLSGAAPTPPTSLRVEAQGDDLVVHTGAAVFTVHRTGSLLDGPGLRGVDFLLRSDERIYKASQWPGSELVVEEQNPLRVVLKRTGAHAWVDGRDRALDYVVRIVAYA